MLPSVSLTHSLVINGHFAEAPQAHETNDLNIDARHASFSCSLQPLCTASGGIRCWFLCTPYSGTHRQWQHDLDLCCPCYVHDHGLAVGHSKQHHEVRQHTVGHELAVGHTKQVNKQLEVSIHHIDDDAGPDL